MNDVSSEVSAALIERENRHMAPGLQSMALFAGIAVRKAEGVVITDEDGRSYIDLSAGVAVGSIGHCHPRFVELMTEQLAAVTFGSFCTENRVRFLELLASLTPGTLDRIQMYSGGAEAVEAAMRLAKSATGKWEMAGFWGGFHGKTGGVLGLLGDTSFKKDLGPLMPGSYSAGPYASCYRCPLKMRHPECGLACVDLFRQSLRTQSCHQLAAIIVEPIQGTAGNVVPPPGFLTAVKSVAEEFEALLIADEMITGFGRTGRMWGVDHDGVVPDVMTLGKGIGGGFPMSAIASTSELTEARPFGNPSGSSSSYGGNPLAATAGRAALEVLIDEDLVENAARVGKLMKERLQQYQEGSAIVGDVRGEGLMIGVELVADRKTREPLDKALTRRLFHECLARGLVIMAYNPVVRINPPLVITEDEASRAMDILIDSLEAISA